jgi:hypothetical protein
MQIPPSAGPRAADIMESWNDVRGFLNQGETSFSPTASPRRASGRRTPRSGHSRRRGRGSVLDDSVVGEWSVDSIAELEESGGDEDDGDGRRVQRGSSASSARYRSTSSTRRVFYAISEGRDQQASRTKHIRSDTQQTVRPFFSHQNQSLVDSPGEEQDVEIGGLAEPRPRTAKKVSLRFCSGVSIEGFRWWRGQRCHLKTTGSNPSKRRMMLDRGRGIISRFYRLRAS